MYNEVTVHVLLPKTSTCAKVYSHMRVCWYIAHITMTDPFTSDADYHEKQLKKL